MAALDIWCVAAAAILLNEKSELHYNEVADRILKSELTNLARKGKTPEQTVGVIMRECQCQNRLVFKKTGEGYYALVQPKWVKLIPEVQHAMMRMASKNEKTSKQTKKNSTTEEISGLRARVAKLESENKKFREVLKTVEHCVRHGLEKGK